jgi:general secretion pathway protein K
MPIIAVMWGLGLLAAVALSLNWNGNLSTSLAHNALDVAKANAIVEAAINRAVVALYEQQPERRWKADGTPQLFEFDGTKIKVSLQDELGKIDLNQADETAFVNLLRSIGLDGNSSAALADKIVDWRTATSLKHLNGAKEAEYRASGSAFRPRNGQFQSVDELLLVMDMTPEIFRRIEPALTVYSARQFIDPQVAPREALRSLPGMTPEMIEAALATRQTQDVSIDGLAGSGGALLSGRAFAVRTEFQATSGTIRHEAVVRITGNSDQPYWLLSWKYK